MEKLKILLVTPELYPFSKNTGFAYVLNSLAKGFCELGHDIRIVIPKYQNSVQEFNTLVDFPVQIDWNKATAIIRESHLDYEEGNIPVYFVDNYQYFDRETPYNHYDEAERFAFFCRSILEMLPKIGFKPDIIHCNDWETGLIPVMLKEQYKMSDFYKNIRVVFTIHNMQYQGNYPKDVLKLFNLDDSYYTSEKLEFYGNVSFMKAGLMYSDIITTLSRTYATKLQTSDFGEKMEGVLQLRREDFYGIINGVDYNIFNSETDSNIFCNYNIDNLEEKVNNKYHLQSELGMPTKDVPVLAIVTKFRKDRGFDLLEEIFDEIMLNDIQLIFLGKGDIYYENMLIRAKGKYTDKIGLWIGDNQDLEHRIYAGSDIFLSPSQFEILPYRHMVAMRYGTVPVVKANGDIDDIVKNYSFAKNKGNGFAFSEYSSIQLLDIIKKVISLYEDRKDVWKKVMKNCMNEDFSFSRTVREYIEIYKVALRKK